MVRKKQNYTETFLQKTHICSDDINNKCGVWNRLPSQVFYADVLTAVKIAVEGWVWLTQ